MNLTRIPILVAGLVLMVSGAGPAVADMVIRLKDGSHVRIPVRPGEVASIRFGAGGRNATVAPAPQPRSQLPPAPKPVENPAMAAPAAASKSAATTTGGAPKLTLGTFAERKPRPVPYRDDPEVVRAIESLPAGASTILPNFTVQGDGLVGRWRRLFRNGPYRRDYCNKMVFAPDRGTALYAGANHGGTVTNDAWEFHLRSNTWTMLFAPDGGNHIAMTHSLPHGKDGKNTPEQEDFLRRWFADNVHIKDGTLQTRNGGPIYPRHTWDGLTYDRRTGRMLWAVLSSGLNFLQHYARYTGQDAGALQAQLRRGSNLWMFDPDVGHWVRQTGGTIHPKMTGKGGFLHYIPDLGKSVWFIAQWNDDEGMWAYDDVANTWTRLSTNNRNKFYHWQDGPHPIPEKQVAYSPKHKKLVAVRGTSTHVFDLRTNAWTRVLEDPALFAHDAHTIFSYDSVNDVFLLAYPHPEKGFLKAYSIETNRWTDLLPDGAGVFRQGAAGYFDERHGVFVLYGLGGSTWIYRHGPTDR